MRETRQPPWIVAEMDGDDVADLFASWLRDPPDSAKLSDIRQAIMVGLGVKTAKPASRGPSPEDLAVIRRTLFGEA